MTDTDTDTDTTPRVVTRLRPYRIVTADELQPGDTIIVSGDREMPVDEVRMTVDGADVFCSQQQSRSGSYRRRVRWQYDRTDLIAVVASDSERAMLANKIAAGDVEPVDGGATIVVDLGGPWLVTWDGSDAL